MKKQFIGNLLLLFTAFIWGTAFVFQRVGMDSIEPVSFNAARMALAAVFIGILAIFSWNKEKKKPAGKAAADPQAYKKHTVLGGIFCGIFLSLGSILQQTGLVYTTAGKAGFITAMYILLVPVLGLIILKKKSSVIVWIAVLMGVAGMYFLCMNEGLSFSTGDIYVCICAFFFSFHILCCDHFAARGNAICISAIQFATATVISVIVALMIEKPGMDKFISAAVPILYCGIVSGGIGYTLQMTGQKYTEPATASLLMSLESVFAVITGVLVLHEHMSIREIIGCIIMFAAIILVTVRGEKT